VDENDELLITSTGSMIIHYNEVLENELLGVTYIARKHILEAIGCGVRREII